MATGRASRRGDVMNTDTERTLMRAMKAIEARLDEVTVERDALYGDLARLVEEREQACRDRDRLKGQLDYAQQQMDRMKEIMGLEEEEIQRKHAELQARRKKVTRCRK